MRNACPTCQTVYAVTPADVGRRIVCTRCNASLVIDDDGFRVTDGPDGGKPSGSKNPPPERVKEKEPRARKSRPVEDDEDTVDSTDPPRSKRRRGEDDEDEDEDARPPRTGPLDLFKKYVDIPTVVFAVGVVLVLWFLFMPIVGLAKLKWYTARIEDEQLALDLEVKRLEGNGQGEVAKKKKEDWVKRKEKLESDVQWVQINNRQGEYWDRYGMLAGFVLTALGGIGLLMTHQPTVKKIVGAVVVCAMMVLVFVNFAWKG